MVQTDCIISFFLQNCLNKLPIYKCSSVLVCDFYIYETSCIWLPDRTNCKSGFAAIKCQDAEEIALVLILLVKI